MAASWLMVFARVDNRAAERLYYDVAAQALSGTGQPAYGHRVCANIGKVLSAISSGVQSGNVWVTVTDDAGTKPAGNIACTQANAAGDTITFTFGAKTIVLTEGASGENGFARGASNTTCAANLAACINAHSVLKDLLTATPSVGNCALAAKLPGQFMNDIAMSTNDGTAFAFTALNGGTEGAAQFFLQHFYMNRTTP